MYVCRIDVKDAYRQLLGDPRGVYNVSFSVGNFTVITVNSYKVQMEDGPRFCWTDVQRFGVPTHTHENFKRSRVPRRAHDGLSYICEFLMRGVFPPPLCPQIVPRSARYRFRRKERVMLGEKKMSRHLLTDRLSWSYLVLNSMAFWKFGVGLLATT